MESRTLETFFGSAHFAPAYPTDTKTNECIRQHSISVESCPNTAAGARAKISELRQYFMSTIGISLKNNPCNQWDRAVVLRLLDSANAFMAQGKTATAYKITWTEMWQKVKVVLDLDVAEPYDLVFSRQLDLPPLEPLYAKPRIDLAKDPYGYKADWRLHEWRKGAAEKERREAEREKEAEMEWRESVSESKNRKRGVTEGVRFLRLKSIRDRKLLGLRMEDSDWGEEINANGWEMNEEGKWMFEGREA